MILAVCVEDRLGMMFHQRRVSRDRKVCEDILEMCRGKELYMTAASCRLFEGQSDAIHCVEEKDGFLKKIPEGAFFFVENPEYICEDRTEKIILYRWNRKYPADQYFPVRLQEWDLISTEEFQGNSHEKITKEIYRKTEGFCGRSQKGE